MRYFTPTEDGYNNVKYKAQNQNMSVDKDTKKLAPSTVW